MKSQLVDRYLRENRCRYAFSSLGGISASNGIQKIRGGQRGKSAKSGVFIRRHLALDWDDDKILRMLKGGTPAQFEREIADMFRALGYDTEVVGGANDGGIDVVAHKDGKKYYIQCKKFMTREVTPHDVRDFLGAIINVNNPADKGFFITPAVSPLWRKRQRRETRGLNSSTAPDSLSTTRWHTGRTCHKRNRRQKLQATAQVLTQWHHMRRRPV